MLILHLTIYIVKLYSSVICVFSDEPLKSFYPPRIRPKAKSMCANYKPPSSPQLSLFDSPSPTFDSVSEAFPGDICPILVSGSDHDFAWQQAVFGLVPEWADDLKFSKHTYNARMETVATKPSYRSAWRNNQFALIPMQSFFEPCYESGKAVRHKIERQDLEPFTVAAIWELWSDHLDRVHSFSMLTINADHHPFMKRFHKPQDEKRSLIIVPPDLRKDWINANHRTAQELIFEMSAEQFQTSPFPIPIRPKPSPSNWELF